MNAVIAISFSLVGSSMLDLLYARAFIVERTYLNSSVCLSLVYVILLLLSVWW